MTFPLTRLRRYRRSASVRQLFAAAPPVPQHFLYPLFISDSGARRQEIAALPGQCRWRLDALGEALAPVVAQGIGGVLLFAHQEGGKTADGVAATAPDGLIPQAVQAIKALYPQLVVATDVCLCAYTDHGHCGPLAGDGSVDNDAALELLAASAVAQAQAGADIVAPSAMMDGQVLAIRHALDDAQLSDRLLMSYSTKFASAFYGPFREAAGSAPAHGDRCGYQADPAAPALARRESAEDAAEGADILMVKPALCYLDIISQLRQASDLPLAAFNVSGEYSMLHASAAQGWGDLLAMARESLMAINRAGADIIISYWADRYEEIFQAG